MLIMLYRATVCSFYLSERPYAYFAFQSDRMLILSLRATVCLFRLLERPYAHFVFQETVCFLLRSTFDNLKHPFNGDRIVSFERSSMAVLYGTIIVNKA